MKIFRFAALLICLALLSASAARAAEPLRLEALLIWGTDEAKSPDPSHIPIDPVLAARLAKSPYRWRHYFEVKRQRLEIALKQNKTDIIMSEHCRLDVKNLGNDWAEIKLYGNGKLVSTHTEKLPLVLAGDSKNNTAWMVVIRKAVVEPPKK
jgi:hypothetical protein